MRDNLPAMLRDAAKILEEAADALEQMREREKFHAFVWKTLGFANMRQLEEMYHQFDEEDKYL